MLGRRSEEASHLVSPVVEDQAVPVRMETQPGIGVIEQVGPVELRQCEGVLGKMRRHPVEQHPDAGLMELVDQSHEILGRPVAAGRREEARRLIAPRPVEGVLHQGEEFHMGEPGGVYVPDQRLRHLGVAQEALRIRRIAPPTTQVHLVDRDRRTQCDVLAPGPHPFMVAPLVRQVPHH